MWLYFWGLLLRGDLCKSVAKKLSEDPAVSLTASGPKAELWEALCSHRFQGSFCIRIMLLIPPRPSFPAHWSCAHTQPSADTTQLHVGYKQHMQSHSTGLYWQPDTQLGWFKITPFSGDILNYLSSAICKELLCKKKGKCPDVWASARIIVLLWTVTKLDMSYVSV